MLKSDNEMKENRPHNDLPTRDGFTNAQAIDSHTKDRQIQFSADSDQLEQQRSKLRREEHALKVSTVSSQ